MGGSNSGRVPYPPRWWRARTFEEVKKTALEMAASPHTPTYVASMLGCLEDCEYLDGKQDHEGATYKSIAYAGRLLKLDAAQRQRWIETVEMLGLAQHHVGHIISRIESVADGGFRVGDSVKHAKFGLGEVIESAPDRIVVEFGGRERVFVPEIVHSRPVLHPTSEDERQPGAGKELT